MSRGSSSASPAASRTSSSRPKESATTSTEIEDQDGYQVLGSAADELRDLLKSLG